MTPAPPKPAATAWVAWRRTSKGRWKPVARGATEAEAWAGLDAVRGSAAERATGAAHWESMVLPAGEKP